MKFWSWIAETVPPLIAGFVAGLVLGIAIGHRGPRAAIGDAALRLDSMQVVMDLTPGEWTTAAQVAAYDTARDRLHALLRRARRVDTTAFTDSAMRADWYEAEHLRLFPDSTGHLASAREPIRGMLGFLLAPEWMLP